MAYNRMLARHHQGTQKIVISDNIFVTEKNAVMGRLSMERALMLRYVCSVMTTPCPHLSAGLWKEGVVEIFSVTSHHRLFRLEILKWKRVQIKNGIIVVFLLGLVPTVHVYVVSTLPDKPSPHFLCSHMWLVTEKSMYYGW